MPGQGCKKRGKVGRATGSCTSTRTPRSPNVLTMDAPSALPRRRALGANELLLHTTEARYGGTFRIAGVATLSAPTTGPVRLTAPRLTAAVATVTARYEALRTTVEVGADGQAVFLAADTGVPRVDVRVGAAADADVLTAEAFAASEAVLASGPDGLWPARAPAHAETAINGTQPAAPHLPWQVIAFLSPRPDVGQGVSDGAASHGNSPGSTTPQVATVSAAVVVWLLPHYLADGRSLDFVCAALIDALNADCSTAAASAVAAAGVSRLPPAMTSVLPPWGGRLGATVAAGRFLVRSSLEGLTRSRVRGVVPAAGAAVGSPDASPSDGGAASASAAAARRTGIAVAVVGPAALARFQSAVKAVGFTLGSALVGALAVALVDTGLLAPAGWWRSSVVVAVPMDARRASGDLPDTAVGNYVAAVDVVMAVPPRPSSPVPPQPGAGNSGLDKGSDKTSGGQSRLWVAAGAAATALHAPGSRAAGAIRMGVGCRVVTRPQGRAFLDALVADPVAAGRLLPDPFVSNIGRCTETEAANRRAGDAATGVTVTRLGLWDWEAQMGAPLGLYAATVDGVATLVAAWTEPLVTADAGRAVLAAVVAAVEAA